MSGGGTEVRIAVDLPQRAADHRGRGLALLLALGAGDDGGVEALRKEDHVLSPANRIQLPGQTLQSPQELGDLLGVGLALLTHEEQRLLARILRRRGLAAFGVGGNREGAREAGIVENTQRISIASHVSAADRVYGPQDLGSIRTQAHQSLHPLRGGGHDTDQIAGPDLLLQKPPRGHSRPFDDGRPRERQIEEENELPA